MRYKTRFSNNLYILVAVDYVSKWVEAIPCKKNYHKIILKFLKENVLSRFGIPRDIISDGGLHFCNRPFEALMRKYCITHKVATPYHPQTSGQVELANRAIKQILDKTINPNHKIGLWGWMMHFGRTVVPIKIFLVCLSIDLFLVKLVTCMWNWNINHIG